MSNLTVSVSGTGTGLITSADPVISCPAVCGPVVLNTAFPVGGPWTFELTATPAPGSYFVQWNSGPSPFFIFPENTAFTPQIFEFNNPDIDYTVNAQFEVCPTITVTNPGPHLVSAGVPITPIQLVGTGGTGPYTFEIGSCGPLLCCDAWLEGGLDVDVNGLITGTPSVYGCAECMCAGGVVVTDANGCFGTVCISFQQSPCGPCPVISYTPHGPFNYTVGQPFTPVTFIPSGGVGPYTFDINPDSPCAETPACFPNILPLGMSVGAASGTLSGTPTTEALCEWIPLRITDSNQCSTTSCFRMVIEEPLPTCYYLVPCFGGLTLLVTNNFAIYLNQVVQILGQCFTVLQAPNCVGAITLPNPVITVFPDCCSCNPPTCYELRDCTGLTPVIVTSTDLSQYVGQTVKVCDFQAGLVLAINKTNVINCTVLPPTTLGFITQITGPTSGFFYEDTTGLILPYTNPSSFAVVAGGGSCFLIGAGPTYTLQSAVGPFTQIIQFFIGTTAITNPIPVNSSMSQNFLQYLITQNSLDPNIVLTIGYFNFSGLNVQVTITGPTTETTVTATITSSNGESSVTEEITGSCICYTVFNTGPNCNCQNTPFTGVISGVFADCVCCDPPDLPDPELYVPTPPEIDKHTYRVCESQCDIDANKEFASAQYDLFKQKQYGIASCCNINLDKAWIAKELSDFSKIKCS